MCPYTAAKMGWQNRKRTISLVSATTLAVVAGFNIPRLKQDINRLIIGQHFNVGVVSILDSEYEKAVDNLTEALKRDPNFILAYKKRGVAYLELGEYDLALQDYTQVLQQQEADADTFLQLGRTHLNLEDYPTATSYYDKAINANRQLDQAYIGRGIAHYKQKKYWQALDDLNQALEINENSVQAYLGRGLVYARLSGFDQAIEDYGQALLLANDNQLEIVEISSELEPDSAIAYLSLGMARYNKRNMLGALSDLEKSTQLDPEYLEAYFLKGIIYIEQKQYELASEAYKQALKYLEKDKSGLGISLEIDESSQLPTVKQVFKDFSADQKGIKTKDKVIAIDGQSVTGMPLADVIELFHGAENTPSTVQIQKEGKEIVEVSLVRDFSVTQHLRAAILAGLAVSYEGLKNTDEALAKCQEAEEINIRNAFAYQLCGTFYQTKGDIENAKENYQLALELYTAENNKDGITQVKRLLKNL